MPLILIFMMLANFPSASTIEPLSPGKGPRTEDLVIRFYSNVETAYAALKAGDIDIVGSEITSDLYADAIFDPNIVLGPVGDRGKYQFDINSNYTCSPLFPGRRSPTSYLNFRRALAFLVDKTQIVDTFCGGFANRIDQPISYSHRGWRDPGFWYEDGTYPYEFNGILAAAAFDAAGFVAGPDANPEPDLGQPGYTATMRIHPDTPGVTMDELEVYCRTDDLRRLEAGRALCDQLRILGIPVNQIEAPASVCYPMVMDNFAYHVYTGGWSLGRFPPVDAYRLYHSSQYMLGGSNYVTGNDSMGNPMYSVLDSHLYDARFPANLAGAQAAARNAFGEHVDQCVTIELFSAASYWAWSSKLLGVVNADGTGPENGYTFMNAYKIDDTPIFVGLINAPQELNKIYSSWYYDYQCLDRMDLYSGMDVAPYDQSVDQAGYILDWITDTWVDPDDATTKSKISQIYRDDAWFVEPVTGNQLEHVNITHHYASIWYEYQLSDAWNHDAVADIKTLRMPNSTTIEIYWNVSGYWNTYMGTTSIKSFNWFSQGTLSQTVTDNNLVPDGSGYIGCTEPVFYVLSITGDGSPLILGTDYDIYMDPDGPHNADVRIISGSYADVDITYLATDDANGYTPGNLPWAVSFEGAGMYYAVDHTSLIGGYLALKRNSFYWMETPTLGEIDFVIRSSGEFEVDMFDFAIVASAFGSQGTGVPDSHWFAGADVAPPAGVIDIIDVTTVTGGMPPIYDVAVINVNTSKAGCLPMETVGQGANVSIYATVENQGSTSETFNVTAYHNSTPIGIQQVTLNPDENVTLTFLWNTLGVSYGNYTIRVTAETVLGETDTADNTMIDGTVLVTIIGDVDGDRDVDIFDIVRICNAYQMTYPNPSWDPNADIIENGKIDIFDVVAAAGNYKESW